MQCPADHLRPNLRQVLSPWAHPQWANTPVSLQGPGVCILSVLLMVAALGPNAAREAWSRAEMEVTQAQVRAPSRCEVGCSKNIVFWRGRGRGG